MINTSELTFDEIFSHDEKYFSDLLETANFLYKRYEIQFSIYNPWRISGKNSVGKRFTWQKNFGKSWDKGKLWIDGEIVFSSGTFRAAIHHIISN